MRALYSVGFHIDGSVRLVSVRLVSVNPIGFRAVERLLFLRLRCLLECPLDPLVPLVLLAPFDIVETWRFSNCSESGDCVECPFVPLVLIPFVLVPFEPFGSVED